MSGERFAAERRDHWAVVVDSREKAKHSTEFSRNRLHEYEEKKNLEIIILSLVAVEYINFFPILFCPIPKQNSVGKSSNTKKEEKKDKETGGRRKTKYQLCFPFHFFAVPFFPVPFFDIQGLGRRPPPLGLRRRSVAAAAAALFAAAAAYFPPAW